MRRPGRHGAGHRADDTLRVTLAARDRNQAGGRRHAGLPRGGPDADAHRQLVGRKGAGLRRAEPGTPQVCIPRGCPESPADPIIVGKAQDEDPGFDTRRVPEGDDHPHTGEVGQLLQVWAQAPSI